MKEFSNECVSGEYRSILLKKKKKIFEVIVSRDKKEFLNASSKRIRTKSLSKVTGQWIKSNSIRTSGYSRVEAMAIGFP